MKTLSLSLLLFCSSFVQADIIPLTADVEQSAASGFGGSPGGVLNDGFAYDPDNPTLALPDQAYTQSANDGWHGSSTNPILALLFDTTHSEVSVDFYGRADCCQMRDDTFTVQFYNGGWDAGSLTESFSTGLSTPTAPFHFRIDADVSTFADRVQFVGAVNNFTVMEVRAVTAVPEPSTIMLLSSGLFLVALRRLRRAA